MVAFNIKGVTGLDAGQSYFADPTGFFTVDDTPNFRADNLGTRVGLILSLNPRIAGRGGSRSCQVYCGRPDTGFTYSSSFTVPQASSATAQGNKSVNRRLAANQAQHWGVTQPGGTIFVGRGNKDGPIRRRDGEAVAWSEALYMTVNYAEVPPAPDTSLGLDQITSTSMRFRFSSTGTGDSPITGWVVQYSKSPTFASGVTTISSSGTSTITNLDPGSTYYFRAAGRNIVSDGNGTGHYGPWGTTRSATTLAGTPGAPATTTLTELSPTSMKIDWTTPTTDGGSAITGYSVEYSQNEDFSGSTTDTLGVVLTWTSPTLSAGTWYFRVRAINANGSGVPGSVVSNTVTQTGFIKVNLGGTSIKKPVKAYIGGTFTQKPMKRYSGGAWVTLT